MGNIAELIENFCDVHSDECSFYGDYSGRGMFGIECVGVVCSDNTSKMLVRLCDFLHEAGIDCVEDALGNICQDSLGMDTIVYFPKVHL